MPVSQDWLGGRSEVPQDAPMENVEYFKEAALRYGRCDYPRGSKAEWIHLFGSVDGEQFMCSFYLKL